MATNGVKMCRIPKWMSPFPQSAKCRYLKFILGTCCRLIKVCFLHVGQSVFNLDQFVHYVLFYFGSQHFCLFGAILMATISFPGFSKCTDMLFLLTTKETFFHGGPWIPPMKAGSCAVKDVLFKLISCHLHVINFSPFISHFLENPDNNHFLSFWRREKCSNV